MTAPAQRFCLSVLLFATARSLQLFGLWPFCFDQRSQQFRRSGLLTVYSWFVLPVALLMFAQSLRTIHIVPKLHLGRISSHAFIVFWALLIVAAQVSVFCTVHWHGATLARLLAGAGRLLDDIGRQCQLMSADVPLQHHSYGDAESYAGSLAQYAGMTMLLHVLDLGSAVYHISNITPAMLADWMAMVSALLPVMLVNAMPHTVYGLLLALRHNYRLLNWRLDGLVGTLRLQVIGHAADGDGAVDSGDGRPAFRRMQVCCVLSDRLDELAVLHRRLTAIAQQLNAVIAGPLLTWTMYSSVSLVSKLFIQYMEFVVALSEARAGNVERPFRPREMFLNLVSVLTSFGGMAALANACVATVNEVKLLGSNLHVSFRFKEFAKMLNLN